MVYLHLRTAYVNAMLCCVAGLLLRVPKFSKYLHGVTSLYPNRIDSIPYWFLPADKEGYVMTPASWEEMADPKDPYLKVIDWQVAWSFMQCNHRLLSCHGCMPRI